MKVVNHFLCNFWGYVGSSEREVYVSESVVSGVLGRRHVIEENIIRAVYEFCHSVTSRVGYVGSAVRVATVEIALHDCWKICSGEYVLEFVYAKLFVGRDVGGY